MDKKDTNKKISMPQLLRLAHVSPKTLNEEERTVDIIWTTGSRVMRHSFFDGPFIEELGMDKKEVRMGRLENSAPFLDNHGMTEAKGVRQTIGVVQSAKLIPGKEGIATIRFSKRADVEEIFQDVKDGILKHVSVGYNVHRMEKTGEENEVPIFRITDWEPIEISLVPAGADDAAVVRSNESVKTECVVVESKKEEQDIIVPKKEERTEVKESENDLEKNINKNIDNPEKVRQTKSTNKGEVTMDPKTKEEILKEGRELEKKRATDIRSLCGKVNLDSEISDKWIEENKSVDEVRTLVIDTIAERDSEKATKATNEKVTVGEDNTTKFRKEGIENAILHRYKKPNAYDLDRDGKPAGFELNDNGKRFYHKSLTEIAENCVRAMGVNTEMLSKQDIVDIALNNKQARGLGGLHSTSDFPEILANVANKTLRMGYMQAPKTWGSFTREVTAPDFKEISRTNLGDAPKLEEVGEGGEVTRGTISENSEKYRVKEFAKILGITRKIIFNDDLSAFTLLSERMGRRAADLESDLVYEIFKLNAALSDTFALFSSQHANLASTAVGAPSEAALSEMRTLMRRQKGLDGAEISLTPKWIIVPPALETIAEKLVVQQTQPNNTSDNNPFGPRGRTNLQLEVEPRLETGTGGSLTAWFGNADIGQIDMIELARLQGSNGPQIQTRDGFDVHGVEIKIMHDVAAKAIDFRGLFKNNGI